MTPDPLLVSLLRGGPVDARALARADVGQLIAGAEAHGALPIVADRLAKRTDLPRELRAGFEVEARRYAAVDLAREAELRRLVAAFAKRRLRVMLLKGAHVAYALYARPDLRPRVDTDLMVGREDRDAVNAVLAAEGYQSTGHVAGSLVMYQACYVKGHPGQTIHAVDVHWKIANPQVFADLLRFDEMAAEAVVLPALGEGAWGLSDVHALLVACVHRVAHHYDSDRLIWLYDIHLLASRLTDEAWRRFDGLSRERGVRVVCRRSLDRAVDIFASRVPEWVSATNDPDAALEASESATAAFLHGRRHVDVVMDDLRALPSWSDRARLVSQHMFPSPTYMRTQYAGTSPAPLPVLYARRLVRGAWKWLRKP